MLALKIIFCIILFILYVAMMGFMIILERDKPKNMIIWSVVFLCTQIIGYIIFIASRYVFYKKKQSLTIKQKEDEIYNKLISKNVYDNKANTNNEVFNFTKLAFNANITVNNSYEFFDTYENIKENLIKDITNANHTIIFEITKINTKDFQDVKNLLIEKAKANVDVRFVYDRSISYKFIKELKEAGVRAYRFSKLNTVGRVYSNLRNIIVIDGKIAYFANLDFTKNQLSGNKEISASCLKVKGDVVQDVNILAHKDTIFASGKYIEYKKAYSNELKNSTTLQFVTNQADNAFCWNKLSKLKLN